MTMNPFLLQSVGILLMMAMAGGAAAADRATGSNTIPNVVVFGATPGGIAAAVAASREGASVLLLEPTRHVGGLHTSGLSIAEWAQNWDTFGGILDEFFRRLGQAYGSKDRQYQWESKVAERVYEAMLSEAKVTVLREKWIDRVEKLNGRIVAVTVADGSTYRGRVFIDASYEGDLMARAGVSHSVGRESREQYHESLAGVRLDPQPVPASPYDDQGQLLPDVTCPLGEIGPEGSGDRKVMVYNFRVILQYVGDNNPRPLPKPKSYDAARHRMLAGVLKANPGIKLEDLFYLPSRPNGKVELNNRQDATVSLGLLGAQHAWPEAVFNQRQKIWQDYKDYTLGYLYYLANEPTVPPQVQKRMRQFTLPEDEFPDNDHWPYQIYVREARRMVGDYVMIQQDIQDHRDKPDSIALGSHWLDCHHVQRLAVSASSFRNEGRFWIDLQKKPCEIPYRSLTPKAAECDNLLVPVCLSASHVAFSSIRVEEVWMMLGQAAGTAAAMAAKQDQSVQAVNIDQLRDRLRLVGLYVDRSLFEPSSGPNPEPARPPMTEGEPMPGKFVKQQSEEFRGTGVHHGLYLPTNWQPGRTYPVIVEYAPNRWEELTGKVEDCRLGFHLSGGRDFIWGVFPYVDPTKKENVVWWWGSEDATIEYCLTNLRRICTQFGGDPNAVLFTGFSRGAIAAGYLALRHDSIADVWLGFLPHSHIDGGRFTPDGARERLGRTRGRPTFVTYGSDDDGKNESPKGARILRELGFPVVERELAGLKHTDRFLEADSLVRREMRNWIAAVLKQRPGTWTVRGRVVDQSGKGVPGVRVQCGTWHGATTDEDGRYEIPTLTAGRRALTARKAGLRFGPDQQEIGLQNSPVEARSLVAYPASAGTSSGITNSLGMEFVPAGTSNVLVSRWETWVRDFAAFVKATGYDPLSESANGKRPYTLEADKTNASGYDWKQADGSWHAQRQVDMRTRFRGIGDPRIRFDDFGFRCVLARGENGSDGAKEK
jgi:predicted esterase